MSADQFRAALERLNLTQLGAARFLDVGERTVRRWATEDGTLPRSVVMLFTLMERFGLMPDDL